MHQKNILPLVIKLVSYLAIPAIISLTVFFYIRSKFISPIQPDNKEIKSFEVAENETFNQVAENLEQKGFIRSAGVITFLARLKSLDKSVKAGEYGLSKSMSPRDILLKIASGKPIERKVTIPEGTSIRDIGALFEKAGIITKVEFDAVAKDPKLLTKAGIIGENFEGYLFPETYQFSRPVTADKVIWKLLEEAEARWKPEYSDKAEEYDMTRHEILTLASIIEKESGDSSENAKISAVFHNRLKQNMKLQSDPTVIYGIKNFNGNITKENLETPSPYNTYTISGLPPGPICNPSESAIKASLYPEQSDYLFFVGDGKGRHVFSTSLSEHNKWVNLYQRAKSIESNADAASIPAPSMTAEPLNSPTQTKK